MESEISWKQQTSWPIFCFGGMDIIPMLMRSPVHRFSHIMGVLRVIRGKCREWLMWMNCKGLPCGRKVFIRLKSIDSRVKCCRSSNIAVSPQKGILVDWCEIRENVSNRFFLDDLDGIRLSGPISFWSFPTLKIRFISDPTTRPSDDFPFPQQPGSSAERHPWVKVEAFLGLSLDLETWIHQGTQKIKIGRKPPYC